MGHSLSEGTLASWNHTIQDLLKPVEEAICTYLQQAPVIHIDETGMRVEREAMPLYGEYIGLYLVYDSSQERKKSNGCDECFAHFYRNRCS